MESLAVLRLGRAAAHGLSPAGLKSRLTILIHHRVLPARDALQPNVITAAGFWRHIDLIDSCFRILPLSEAVTRLREGTLPSRAACITFDDGYADNVTVALHILQQRGLPATFFVASDYLDGGRMFNDTLTEAVRAAPDGRYDARDMELGCYALDSVESRVQAIDDLIKWVKYLPPKLRQERVARVAERLCGDKPLPDNLMMTSDQLLALRDAGMEIGAHTASHPILAQQSDEEARADILRGKQRLEEILGERVRLFAYPNGRPGLDYRLSHVRMVEELGFDAAVSTARGVATRQTDHFQLPRFAPWSRQPVRAALQLLRNLTTRSPDPPLLS